MNNRKSLFIFAIIFMFFLTGIKADDRHRQKLAKQLSIYNNIIKELDLFYVDSIMPEKMINKSIEYMLRYLDPYTEYYPEEKNEELKLMTTGKYAGIGSVIRFHTEKNTTVIADPYKEMPAYKAGLRAGDLILSVNGTSVVGMSSDSVSDMLRGEAGTKLTLEIEQPGKKGKKKVTLERASILLPPIPYYGIQNGDVGYILLESFTDDCAKKMRRAVIELKKQGAKSFVIDLRGNGGGLLNEAVDIVNIFVPKGKTIVTTKGKTDYSNDTYKTSNEPVDTVSPLAVLVDGQSASASEIVAGSLQDLDRAVIVGSRTFGKGLVQSTRPVNYGGYLKLTTAKYYIPSGRCVQALDYSHMIDDGRTSRLPDSLTNVFRTAAGREVRDGGGIRPDIEPKPEELSTLLYYLMQDMAIFDFATEFHLKNQSIAPAETFTISDEVYDEFKKYLRAKNFSYDLHSVKILNELKKMIELEGLTSIAKEEVEALEKKLQANLDHSLTHFGKEVKAMIGDEIIKRYYGQEGEIVFSLREDPELKECYDILKDSKRYNEILSPKKSN